MTRGTALPLRPSKALSKAEDFYYGIPPKTRYDTKSKTFVPVPGTGKPPVPYRQAIKNLILGGTPARIAAQIVNGLYAPGEGGRPRTRAQKTKGSLGW